jgi:quercetin dioxygenase-like cupin family protein
LRALVHLLGRLAAQDGRLMSKRRTFAWRNDMPVIAGFDTLACMSEEQITDKIGRRVVSGKQGTMVYWRIKAGAHAAAHKHPHEQFVWMVKGTMDFRIGNEKRTMKPGDVAVIPGGVEHEGYFPEDSEAIDFFAPVREDFLTGAPPSYMTGTPRDASGSKA